jgi:hypothetical protein
MLAFCPSLSQRPLQLISEIANREKAGITLSEFTEIALNNRIGIPTLCFRELVDGLKKFKVVNEKIFEYFK